MCWMQRTKEEECQRSRHAEAMGRGRANVSGCPGAASCVVGERGLSSRHRVEDHSTSSRVEGDGGVGWAGTLRPGSV